MTYEKSFVESLQEGNTAIVGTQFGDEGKGKGTNASNSRMCARGQGGRNAGHTFVGEDGSEINTHLLPSMINKSGVMNIIGHGTYVDPVGLVEEINEGKKVGIPISPENLAVGERCQVVMPKHIELDRRRENGQNGQGTTRAGIPFVAADMMLREGIRVVSLLNESHRTLYRLAYEGLRSWVITEYSEEAPIAQQIVEDREKADAMAKQFVEAAEALKPYITDTVSLIQDGLAAGNTVTLEGAQAFGLDIRRGKYPYVTSSDTLVLGLASGTGINHKQIGISLGAAKAFPSQVGGGGMVTEEDNPERAQILRGKRGAIDGEYGKSTGRERNVGYLDLVMLKEAAEANGLDGIMLNKVDIFGRCTWRVPVAVAYELDGRVINKIPADIKELERCIPIYEYFDSSPGDLSGVDTYQDLPASLQKMIEFSEDFVGIPFRILGTGPGNDEVIFR